MNKTKKQRDMSHSSLAPEWSTKHGFTPFGNRLNFLSPEVQHMHDGRLRILPPLGDKNRVR